MSHTVALETGGPQRCGTMHHKRPLSWAFLSVGSSLGVHMAVQWLLSHGTWWGQDILESARGPAKLPLADVNRFH